MSRVVAVVVGVLIMAAAAGGYWRYQSRASQPPPPAGRTQSKPGPQAASGPAQLKSHNRSKTQTKPNPPAANTPSRKIQQADASPPKAPARRNFCARDFSNAGAHTDDVAALAKAGGLVYIFAREARLEDPYGCADFYLGHGLDIDAVDPRPGHGHLTGLDFAIKRNDPKMVRFMLNHGADARKPAGDKHLKPYSYALYLALQDQRIDRNKVIEMLNAALKKQADGNH